ncbi:ATP-NAD kinase family protein [Sandarakinorhabdus sp. DWP1-3-1]|uniref:ATP-NAD kinase family protein n=1 Tax=Sandarakinorhabdus sp. DWP1-3-1 TaxID=2804627 RepID=UPI003CF7A64A
MRLGFVVNPIAGTGGVLGLKGSDDLPAGMAAGGHAAARAARALAGLSVGGDVLTSAGAMGADVLQGAGLAAQVVHRGAARSAARDTTAAVAALAAAGADVIVFVGGDGTARDVMAAAVPVPVLGVPAGVKMHSAVFATSPAAARAMLADIAARASVAGVEAEVIDRDGDGAPRLFGMMQVPALAGRQPAKAMGRQDDDARLQAAIAATAAELATAPLLVVGPGATMLALKRALGAAGTLLGVDVFAGGAPVAADVDEATLWQLCAAAAPRLALGVIGGQGFLLGRGNQQISARVLARMPLPPVVLASAAKLAALPGGRLLVDSGDEALDARLAGHLAVRTGRRQTMMMRVCPA